MVKEIVEQTRKGEIGGSLSIITGMLAAKASPNGEYVMLADFYGYCTNIMVAVYKTMAANFRILLR
jgi:hypothetical protein